IVRLQFEPPRIGGGSGAGWGSEADLEGMLDDRLAGDIFGGDVFGGGSGAAAAPASGGGSGGPSLAVATPPPAWSPRPEPDLAAPIVEARFEPAAPSMLLDVTPLPEPATWMQLIAGFALMGAAARRRRARAA